MNSYVLIFLVFFPMIMGLINYFISKKQSPFASSVSWRSVPSYLLSSLFCNSQFGTA